MIVKYTEHIQQSATSLNCLLNQYFHVIYYTLELNKIFYLKTGLNCQKKKFESCCFEATTTDIICKPSQETKPRYQICCPNCKAPSVKEGHVSPHANLIHRWNSSPKSDIWPMQEIEKLILWETRNLGFVHMRKNANRPHDDNIMVSTFIINIACIWSGFYIYDKELKQLLNVEP